MSKLCRQCGQVLGDDELYCRSCGAKQASSGYATDKQPVMTESMQHPVGQRHENAQQYAPYQQNAYQPVQQYQQRDAYPTGQNYYQQPAAPVKKKSKKGLIIGLISGVLVIAIVVSMFFVFGQSTKIKQDSPEKLFDSTCSVLEKSLNSKKMFSEKELNAICEYKNGNKSAKYMVTGYYNIAASYLSNTAVTSQLTAYLGSDIKLTYMINNKTVVESAEYQNYVNTQYGVSLSDIQEMDRYDLSVTISGTANSQTTTMEIPVVKVKGKWYFILGQAMDPAGVTRVSYSSLGY